MLNGLIVRPRLLPAFPHNGLRQKRVEHARVLVLVQERYWIMGREHRVRLVWIELKLFEFRGGVLLFDARVLEDGGDFGEWRGIRGGGNLV